MAEDVRDPRDVAWHPRRRHVLLGHHDAEMRLLQAFRSGKLHHAWLISGSRGIGKATLAYRFARFLLHEPDGAAARTPGSLEVPAGASAARQVAAGAHAGLLVVERALDTRSKRLKNEISVDDARRAQTFFGRTAASGGWRVAIVDAADDLNTESANALLKIIEEPPSRSIFLLVCHQPGRLLRTIRSRCLHLPLSALDTATTLEVLESLPPEALAAAGQGMLQQAAELSRGSPGRALELAGSKGAAAFEAFRKLERISPLAASEIGAMLAGRDTADDFMVFCDLLIGWIGERSRERAMVGRGAALAAAHDDIATSLRQTDALNLDRRQAVTDALMRLDAALKAS